MPQINYRKDSRLILILCASAALLGSEGLIIGSTGFERTESAVQLPALRFITAALTAAAGVLTLLPVWNWKPKEQRAPLLAALACPVLLAGIYWLFSGSAGAVPGALAASLLLETGFYYRSEERELRSYAATVRRHQAMVLQEQMQPHFTFNVLSAIRGLCETDPAKAAEGLDSLSSYLRQNMGAISADFPVPFARELAHIEAFVTLEKLRAPGQFEVVYDLQELDFSVPALSIQPLVENAILHGVRALDSDGLVVVSTERQGDYIRVIVEDNGHGFPRGVSERQKERLSHGLENLHHRPCGICEGRAGPLFQRVPAQACHGGKGA